MSVSALLVALFYTLVPLTVFAAGWVLIRRDYCPPPIDEHMDEGEADS